MRAALIAILGALEAIHLVACADTNTRTRIEQVQSRHAANDWAIAQAELDVSRLSARWDEVIARYTAAQRAYKRAQRRHQRAMVAGEQATTHAHRAIRDWDQARRNWKLYRGIVLTAIALEAGRYQSRPLSCAP